MVCSQCGNELEPQARFCSRCGAAVPEPSPGPSSRPLPEREGGVRARDWETHIKVLAWLMIAGGVLLVGLPGIGIMFAGHFLRFFVWPPDIPFDVPHMIGPLAALLGLGFLAIAAGVIATGVGLMRYREWARVVALIFSALMVLNFPLGTAIAIYAFWVLLSNDGSAFYRGKAQGSAHA